ncbi:MAG: reverse transcriptase/maturase family protein [Patescibacteria group bacterium]
MKYYELVTAENLFSAWYAFRKGKQNKWDVMEFERNLEDNIFQLLDELNTKNYKHRGYSTFHVYDPKFRIINKACVRDRVVHHLVYDFLEPIFQPTFIHHSYACQKEKGIHKAVEELSDALRQASCNDTRQLWSLKLDIKKFFDSISQDVLLQLLKRKIKDQDTLWFFEEIIQSYHSTQGLGIGLPIGNLTSQIFANIYLSELDYYAKCTLHERYYFRYADDFIFLHHNRAYLEQIEADVKSFVTERLRMTVHPGKISYRKFTQGIDFVGYVLLPHYRVLRTKTKQRMFKKVMGKVRKYNAGTLDEWSLDQCTQSYFGLLTHCSGYRMKERLQNEIWLGKVGIQENDDLG